MKSNKRRGSYGFDAPFLWPVFLVLIVLSLIGGVLSNDPWSFVGTAAVIACISLAFYAATKGKFVVWEKLLNNFGFKGDEQVLDIGCGRGAVLLLAAKHLTTGKAVGIDSGNVKTSLETRLMQPRIMPWLRECLIVLSLKQAT